MFVLPFAVASTVLVATWRNALVGLPGLASGVGVPLLYVAYLNRGGPWTVCEALGQGGQRCTDEWIPWPWVATGASVLLAGVVVFVVRRRKPQSARPQHPSPNMGGP